MGRSPCVASFGKLVTRRTKLFLRGEEGSRRDSWVVPALGREQQAQEGRFLPISSQQYCLRSGGVGGSLLDQLPSTDSLES